MTICGSFLLSGRQVKCFLPQAHSGSYHPGAWPVVMPWLLAGILRGSSYFNHLIHLASVATTPLGKEIVQPTFPEEQHRQRNSDEYSQI